MLELRYMALWLAYGFYVGGEIKDDSEVFA